MKTPQTDQWLIKYSKEHLLHELKMFWWLAQNVESQKDYMHDALLESFVLHLRNLIWFFCKRRKCPDDVIAADFFDRPSNWTKGTSTSLEKALVRANKEMSHLTAQRKDTGDPTKPWEVAALFKEITALAKEFAAQASKNKLNDEVRQLLEPHAALLSIATGTMKTGF